MVRRASSVGVRPSGRRAERRVKRTSVGIWRREEVRVKMLVGEKGGRVLRRKARVVIVRIRRARETLGGMGRMGIPWMEGAARRERYLAIAFGRNIGPKKRRRDFNLWDVSTRFLKAEGGNLRSPSDRHVHVVEVVSRVLMPRC